MIIKLGKYLVRKDVKDVLEIYKISAVSPDKGIITSDPMIEIQLIKEVPLKKDKTRKSNHTKGPLAFEYYSTFKSYTHLTGYGKYTATEIAYNFREITKAELVLYGIS